MALEISNLGRRISGDTGFPRPQFNYALEYYVDGVAGDNDNSGRTWDYAFKTIQAALDAHALLYETATRKHAVIWIKPGVYAENLTGNLVDHKLFWCHLIGLGFRGTDTQAEIHPTTGSCLAADGSSGLHLANLRFEVDDAVPMLNMGTFNNSIIEDCTFTCVVDAAIHPTGIDTESCNHLTVRRCDFQSEALGALAYGLAFHGGADKYLHNARIHDNNIFAEIGIWIENNCTATQAVIKRNLVVASVGIGIDDNNGGSYVVDNDVYAPATPIEHAGGPAHTIRNRVQVDAGATAAWQTPDA